jgi:subtilisin
MPRHRSWLGALLLLLACASPAFAASEAAPVDGPSLGAPKSKDAGNGPKRDYVVVFRDSADVTAKVSGFAHSLAVRASHSYRNIFKGFAAGLTPGQYEKVAADPSVAYILPDRATRVEAQIIPTGIARVGAGNDTPGSDSVLSPVDADIAIVDTGIQPDHPDLNVVGGYSCVNPNPRYWGDVYGHGTHVAGTAAALDNGIGVVGVAAGARLWSVKVFDDWGNGRISQYACGLEWIASQRDRSDSSRPLIEVANMSLRTIGSNDNNCGYTNRDPLHRAICRAVSRERRSWSRRVTTTRTPAAGCPRHIPRSSLFRRSPTSTASPEVARRRRVARGDRAIATIRSRTSRTMAGLST